MEAYVIIIFNSKLVPTKSREVFLYSHGFLYRMIYFQLLRRNFTNIKGPFRVY